MTYREFIDHAKDCVEAIGADFTKEDDDWVPVALIEAKGELVIAPLNFDKQLWPQVITGVIQQMKATKVALITSSWMLKLSDEQREAWEV